MLCKLKFKLSHDQYSASQKKNLILRLEGKKRTIDVNKEITYSGYKHNFWIQIHPNGTILFNGGFVKLIHGSNVVSLSRNEIKPAIFKLQKATGLPIHLAELLGVELAMNILLDQKFKNYSSVLKETPNYSKGVNNGGSTYHKGGVDFVFYNKMREVQKKDPEVFDALRDWMKDNNSVGFMRIELRILREMKENASFKGDSLRVIHLLSEKVQKRFIYLWFKHYDAICKRQPIEMSPDYSTPTALRKILAAAYMKQIGLYDIAQNIEQVAKANHLDRNQKYNLNREARELYNLPISKVPIPQVEEMDRKVRDNEEMNQWIKDWGYQPPKLRKKQISLKKAV